MRAPSAMSSYRKGRADIRKSSGPAACGAIGAACRRCAPFRARSGSASVEYFGASVERIAHIDEAQAVGLGDLRAADAGSRGELAHVVPGFAALEIRLAVAKPDVAGRHTPYAPFDEQRTLRLGIIGKERSRVASGGAERTREWRERSEERFARGRRGQLGIPGLRAAITSLSQ